MARKSVFSFKLLIPLLVFALLVAIGFLFRNQIYINLVSLYQLITDRQGIELFLNTFGPYAPLIFILIQIMQVILAPIPGEATGFIGGYLFGGLNGFLFSSIGLTIGSWLNFTIGRIFGKKYVRKLIPAGPLNRFENQLKRQGVIVLFILFLFPGFPKDYLCLFLGLSSLPLKIFLLLSSVGRMPGTLMLSLQGATLFEKMYEAFFILLLICILAVGFAYRYREQIYRLVDKMNKK